METLDTYEEIVNKDIREFEVNGKSVWQFCQTHSEAEWYAVRNFLDYFDCGCEELMHMLEQMKVALDEERRILSEEEHKRLLRGDPRVRFRHGKKTGLDYSDVDKINWTGATPEQLAEHAKSHTHTEEELEWAKRIAANKRKDHKQKPERIVPELRGLIMVVDVCPKCGGIMKGEPMRSCERVKTGRNWYAECSSCNYYYEIFYKKIRNKERYTKIEGGV